MGSPKLLLKVQDEAIIDHVLRAWTTSRVDRVFVVVRDDDRSLQQRCQQWPVDVVLTKGATSDMRRSVEFGLKAIASTHSPNSFDRWLLAPADIPTINATVIDQVVVSGQGNCNIVLPTFSGQRGHPVSFPWSLSDEVFELPVDCGINRLLDGRHLLKTVAIAGSTPQFDIDTPEDLHSAYRIHDAKNR
ncbi:MAG: NTP transferase domain-containing protein [Planctomycetales bacterium]|nr:NTP transferase domain-containing protein [Planctomycetales bacterium]